MALNASLNALSRLSKTASSSPVVSQSALVRPANTTTYDIGDAIFGSPPAAGAPKGLVFNAVTESSGGFLSSIDLIDVAAQSLKLAVDLILFSEEPATAPVDNAVWTPPAALIRKRIAIARFTAASAVDEGGYMTYSAAVNKEFVLPAGVRRLIGVPVVRNAYIPIANEELIFVLHISPRSAVAL